jgi:hypothetical protein
VQKVPAAAGPRTPSPVRPPSQQLNRRFCCRSAAAAACTAAAAATLPATELRPRRPAAWVPTKAPAQAGGPAVGKARARQ